MVATKYKDFKFSNFLELWKIGKTGVAHTPLRFIFLENYYSY